MCLHEGLGPTVDLEKPSVQKRIFGTSCKEVGEVRGRCAHILSDLGLGGVDVLKEFTKGKKSR